MMRSLLLALLAWVACFVLPHGVRAETTVRVVETWPPGNEVRLARNQNFHLRLAYETDEPVGIWVHAYHQGKRANVGSNPSPRVGGSGEAMGWFFFMRPGDVVDEIRIVAGDGSAATRRSSRLAGRIVAGSDAMPSIRARWVVEMREQSRLAQRATTRRAGGTGRAWRHRCSAASCCWYWHSASSASPRRSGACGAGAGVAVGGDAAPR